MLFGGKGGNSARGGGGGGGNSVLGGEVIPVSPTHPLYYTNLTTPTKYIEHVNQILYYITLTEQ